MVLRREDLGFKLRERVSLSRQVRRRAESALSSKERAIRKESKGLCVKM